MVLASSVYIIILIGFSVNSVAKIDDLNSTMIIFRACIQLMNFKGFLGHHVNAFPDFGSHWNAVSSRFFGTKIGYLVPVFL